MASPTSPGLAAARLGLAAAALAATAQALLWWQGLPAPPVLPRYRWGAVALAVAVVLFGLATRGLPTLRAGEPEPEASREARPFALGLAPALALTFVNGLLLLANGEIAATRWLWLGSMLLLFWPARGERIRLPRPALPAALAVGAVLAVALAARAADRANLPLAFHGDMAEMGLGGRELLSGRVEQFVSVGWAAIPWTGFLPAAAGLALSDDLAGLRLSAAVLGTLAVAGVYLLGAFLFGRRVGIVAAAASAIGYTEVHFARLPAYGDPVPFLVFGLYFLLRGLRTGERLCFVAAGALGGVSCLLYYSGRVTPVLMAAVLLHVAIRRPALLRERRRELAAGLAAALVTVGPMLAFYAQHPEQLNARQRDVSVFSPQVASHLEEAYGLTSIPQVVGRQLVRSALAFHHTPDTSLQFGFPRSMLSPFLAPLAALGLATCLLRLRSTGPALLAAWWAIVLLGAAALTADAPFWPRLVVVLPAAALLVAIGFEALVDAIAIAASRPVGSGPRLLAAAALLAVTGAVNWSWYTARARVYVDPAEWVGRLVAAEPNERFCIVPGPITFREEEVRFLAPGQDLRDATPDELASCVGEGRVLILYPQLQPDVMAAADRLAPGARTERHDYPNGAPGPVFVRPAR